MIEKKITFYGGNFRADPRHRHHPPGARVLGSASEFDVLQCHPGHVQRRTGRPGIEGQCHLALQPGGRRKPSAESRCHASESLKEIATFFSEMLLI